MIWLVTEDSNSARDFWIRAFETFVGNSGYKVNPLKVKNGVSTAGNKTLVSQVNDVLKQVEKNDTLFVVIDNIANTKQFVIADFIYNTVNKCKKYNVNFEYTRYYCFEELYLSYSEVERLYSLASNCDINILMTLQYIKNHLLNGTDYYNKKSNEIQYIIGINASAGINREHFANALISMVTKYLGYAFWFSKKGKHKEKSICWTKDCISIQSNMTQQHMGIVCNNECSYCCKNGISREKLLHLENNSLMHMFNKKFEDLITL